MPTPVELFFGIVFSITGMGYMAYGRKNNFYFLVSGMLLIAISFFSFDLTTYLISGAVLLVAPFILSIIL